MMNLKKVVIYVGGFELPDRNAAAHRVVANGKIFRELGYDVVFLGVRSDVKEEFLVKEEIDGFDSWSIPYPSAKGDWLKYIASIKQLRYLLEEVYANRVRYVINYNHPAVAQFRALQLCKSHGVIHLADITEWYDSSAGPLFRRLIKKIDTAARMYFVNCSEPGLITTSAYVTTMYKKSGMPIVELPTLFDVSELSDDRSYDDMSDDVELVYVGSKIDPKLVNKDKSNLKERLDVLVDICWQHKEHGGFSLHIFGNTKSDFLSIYPEYQSKVNSLDGVLYFHGRVDNHLVRKKISSADFSIFVRDSNRVTLAGFPGKLAESISLGTPVITNNMPNISRYRDTGYLYLCERGEEYETVKSLLSMGAGERARLKEQCRKSKLFDYSNYIEDVRDFLQSVSVAL